MYKKTSIGFVYFSENSWKSTGFCSIDGGEIFSFDHVIQLHDRFPNSIFISSLAATALHDFVESHGTWLKHNSYFLTPISMIADEIGISNFNFDSYVTAISDVLLKICEVAERFYVVDYQKEMFFDGLVNFTRINWNLNYSQTDEIASAFNRLMQIKEHRLEESSVGKLEIRLTFNRVKIYTQSMDLPVPVGKWVEITREKFALNSEEKSRIVLVQILRIESGFSHIFEGQLQLGTFSWLTSSELKFVSQFSKVKIHRMFECDESIPAWKLFSNPVPNFNPFDYVSISSGIFADNFLQSCCYTLDPIHISEKENMYSAWIASHIRLKAYNEAAKLMKAGFKVGRISHSYIHVSKSSELAGGNFADQHLLDYIKESNELRLPVSFCCLE